MEIKVLEHELTVCKLRSVQEIDLAKPFYFIGRTDAELSLVCPTADVPARTLAREDGWRGFCIRGVLDFLLVGVLARITAILAEDGISVFAVSTYNTDYILVKKERFERALRLLETKGYALAEAEK